MAEPTNNQDSAQNQVQSSSSSVTNLKDGDGNEITRGQKFWSGLFLISLTLFSALYLIGHWPDRFPTPKESIKPLYSYEWFHVKLVDSIIDPAKINYANEKTIAEKTGVIPDSSKQDTSNSQNKNAVDSQNKKVKEDTTGNKKNNNGQTSAQLKEVSQSKFISGPESKLININTLLLILVAVAGFLGNMIYIASSFTNFIGNGNFRKSWTLWYIVKPFTASGLAIAIYFVFRGGFLNMSDDSTNINLYGLMTISILAGLFTDRTTLKLKEVFDVLLRPKEEREHPLTNEDPQISGITADQLEVGKATVITINGKNLDKKPLFAKIEGDQIKNIDKQASTLTYSYTLPPELKDKESVKLEIVDDKGNQIYSSSELKTKKINATNAGTAEQAGNNQNAGNQSAGNNNENKNELDDADAGDEANKPKN